MAFESNLLEVYQELETQTKKAVFEVGHFVMTQAKLLAPVDLGNLRSSIDFMHEYKNGINYAVIGASANYSIYVEKGTGAYAEDGNGRKTMWTYEDKDGNWRTTKGQRPQPFLRPAIEGNLNTVNKIIEKHLGRG